MKKQANGVAVTPEEFMRVLLEAFPTGTRGWITSFRSTEQPRWTGKAVKPEQVRGLDDVNAYYSVAGFARGVRARRIEEMIGTAVIVVDDPTDKGNAAKLLKALGEPSYKIQTSARSQQWGYLLNEPAGAEAVAPVLRRIASLKLGDSSGNGAVRYARLPCGINNKPEYKRVATVHLVWWKPERRFTLASIAKALGAAKDGDDKRKKRDDDDDGDDVSDVELRRMVREGESFHDPILRLAARWISQGDDAEKVKSRLRDLMMDCEDHIRLSRRWKKTYDDISRNVDSALEKRWAPSTRRRLEDFVAYLPAHSYLFIPTGALWPATSVDACVTWPEIENEERKKKRKRIRPSSWLDQNNPAHSMTWHPGEPMLIKGKVAVTGGWSDDRDATTVNLYMPPRLGEGDPTKAKPWLRHIEKVFPDDATHIIRYFAHRVQKPGEKINHALVLAGDQGIGKDTLLEPLKRAVGEWNFQEVGPAAILGDFNGFVKSVVLRVSEARDLGPTDRFSFYEHMKSYIAAPPDTIRCNEKHIREHYIFNVMGVIITTNHKSDGVYLPMDDRRHYVAMSNLTKENFSKGYWGELWRWYDRKKGFEHVAAYLASFDLSNFDAKAPPRQTAAWKSIVASNHAPEDIELSAAIEEMKEPPALTLAALRLHASGSLMEFLSQAKNRRAIGHRLSSLGYAPLSNPDAKSGLWRIDGERAIVYVKRTLTPSQGYSAIDALRSEGEEGLI